MSRSLPVVASAPIAASQPSDADTRGSFEATCLPYRGEMLAVALRLSRRPADAQDVVQESLLRAMTAWARFEPGTNVRAWLLRIVTNTFISMYRKRRRHLRIASERPRDTLRALYGHDEDQVHPCVEDGETLSDEVQTALAELAPEYRDVIARADLMDQRYRDIAEALRVPIGTVMSRLFRARRQLEARLAGFADTEWGIARAA